MDKPNVPTFYEDDLIRLLGSPELDNSGLSVQDIAQQTGWSEEAAREKVRKLWRAGRIEVGRKRAPRMDGCETLVPAYRLKPS